MYISNCSISNYRYNPLDSKIDEVPQNIWDLSSHCMLYASKLNPITEFRLSSLLSAFVFAALQDERTHCYCTSGGVGTCYRS